ncbi:disease resistance protein RGA5-like [Phragmites australis]|uniref:disease resistance protein RGA5-like n=1 Tax=Phragmites australis TaxID=29695 RepID=UPI002D79076F|nr:disease resistance protein RGA5-like [Phragmites australis]
MEEVRVTCSLGAMAPLLVQLRRLMETEQSLPQGVLKDELQHLVEDLEKINTSLLDLSEEDNPSFMEKCWMKEVRELSYDMEDYLNTVLHSNAAGGVRKIPWIQTKKNRRRPLIVEDISQFRARLQGLGERHETCKLAGLRARLQQDPIERRKRCQDALTGFQTIVNSMLQTPHSVLDDPMNKLVDLLAFDREPKLKVVPIFGFAGVGKTTLARRLYRHYGGRFHCRGFLRVSRNPDTRRLLMSMLSQIKGPRSQGAFSDVQALTDDINTHLKSKTYLIIVDDLWDTSVWDIISHAFPKGNFCSRIITTTQIEDVALACCSYNPECIYEMRPLSDDQSQQLFSGNSEVMKEAVNLIYNDLPPHLKTCLLYLCIYPEDYTIKKDDLVKQWVAEGFVIEVEGQYIEEAAGGYFDELVISGMIQPLDTNYNDEVLSCTVHHMVLDFIACKSMEDNFICVADYFETVTGLPDKVRRLSMKFGGAKSAQIPGSFRMSQVRSLLFSGFIKCVPSIVDYRLLRVLVLHIWTDQGKARLDLATIGELFQLRYLNIECNTKIKLPAKIRGLQHLRTLKVDARVTVVPSDIVHLQCLLHLHLPSELCLLDLGMLTNVQDLHLTCSPAPSNRLVGNMERLASILGKISNLKSLVFYGASSSENSSFDGFSTVSPAPTLLERLELSPRICINSSLPRWIQELSKLRILKIALQNLSSNDVDTLKALPALAALSLYVRTAPAERIIFNKEGFSVLNYFKFVCTAPCVGFTEGAMLTVQRLKLGFSANTMEQYSPVDAGFQHLTGLEVFSAKIRGAGGDESGRKAVQFALEEAFNQHPSPPIINIQLVDWIFDRDKETSTASQKEKHQTTEELKEVESKPAVVMEDALVSASTGAMNSIIMKLTTLMGERYAKLRDMQKEAVILKDEIDEMDTHLEQLAGMAEPSIELKDCRNQMRELTYDIEDYIDDLMFYFDKCAHQATSWYPEKWATLQKFIDQIRNITGQMEKAGLGNMACKTEMRALGSSYYVASESLLSTVSDKGMGLVGVDGQRDQLARRLIDGERELQVVCILGSAGAGKTTLAKEVYNMIQGRFERQAFVTVSKKVNIKMLLRDIISKLGYLRYYHKRYLFVFDGVWSVEMWDALKRVLPDYGCGSRIIITTCVSDVAESCVKHSSNFIHHMGPLAFEDSLSLFRSIVFGAGRSCPIALEDVAEKIVKACGGIPLAVSVIAGVLASKPAEMAEWDMVEKRMELAGADPLSVDGMRKIFDIGYSDLSRDMKSCLLYLSAFTENDVIKKDRLISRWIAEGFLPKRKEETWLETGESYFLELIARKLIEPVMWEDMFNLIDLIGSVMWEDMQEREHYEMPMGCKVGGFVHDFITSLSSEENFVTWDIEDPACMQHDVIRRISIAGYNNRYALQNLFDEEKNIDLQKVRSLTVFGGVGVPHLSAFIHVRVLDLKDCEVMEDHQLESIGHLSLLRYLALGRTDVQELPKNIMELEHLLTIDLRRTSVRYLPVFRTAKLVSLLARDLELSRGVGEMQELEELSKVHVGGNYSLHDAAELVNKLTRLRLLGVRFDDTLHATETNRQGLKHFLEEVGKSNLQSLTFSRYPCDLFDLLLDCWVRIRPRRLQNFTLKVGGGYVSEVPQEMACLIALTRLDIKVKTVEAEGFRALGNLPNLVLLDLHSKEGTRGRCTVSKDGFQRLKVFVFGCWDGRMGLQFEAGAMPQLRTLLFRMLVRETKTRYGDFNFGIQHLYCLARVHASIDCSRATALDVEAAEAAIREQISKIPNHPVLELERRHKRDMVQNQEQKSQK